MKRMQLNLFYEKVTLQSLKSHDHTAEMFTLRCQFPLPVVLTIKRGKTVAADTCCQHTHGPTKKDAYKLTDGYSKSPACEI